MLNRPSDTSGAFGVRRRPHVEGPPLRLLPTARGADLAGILVVAVLGLIAGGLTSFGQGWLPFALSSLSNSVSGWTVVVAAIVFSTRRTGMLVAAVCGAVGLEACNLGYQVISTARGYPYSGEFWLVVALLAGPVVGIAAAWLHRRDLFCALGAAFLVAVVLGDGITGLLFLPTTSPVYWLLSGCVALLLLVLVCVRRLGSWATRSVAIAGAVVGTALYPFAIRLLSG